MERRSRRAAAAKVPPHRPARHPLTLAEPRRALWAGGSGYHRRGQRRAHAAQANVREELATKAVAAGVPTTTITIKTQSRSAGAPAPQKMRSTALAATAAATCGSCLRSSPKGGAAKCPGAPPAARPERSEPVRVGQKTRPKGVKKNPRWHHRRLNTSTTLEASNLTYYPIILTPQNH